jgi:hypothetical protein
MDCRVLFWMNWKYHVRGFLYWGIDAWGDSSSSVNVRGRDGRYWPEIPWDTVASRSGDGYLVYPGIDRLFLSSIRLETVSAACCRSAGEPGSVYCLDYGAVPYGLRRMACIVVAGSEAAMVGLAAVVQPVGLFGLNALTGQLVLAGLRFRVRIQAQQHVGQFGAQLTP